VNKEIGGNCVTVLQVTSTNIKNYAICMSKMHPKKCRSCQYPLDVESMRIFILDLVFNCLLVHKKIGSKCVFVLQLSTSTTKNYTLCLSNMQPRKCISCRNPQDTESLRIFILDLFFNSLLVNKKIGGNYVFVLQVATPNTKNYAICMWKMHPLKCRSCKYLLDVESMKVFMLDLFFHSLLVNKKIDDKCVTVLQGTTTNMKNCAIWIWGMQPKICRSCQ